MSTPYPSLNFGLGEEIDMLRDTVYRFAQAEIAPRAEQIDKDNGQQYNAQDLTWSYAELLGALKARAAAIRGQ